MLSFQTNHPSHENLPRYRSRNPCPEYLTTMDRQGCVAQANKTVTRDSIVCMLGKFRNPTVGKAESPNIFDMRGMTNSPQTSFDEENMAGKTRRRLTSLTDVQPQASFDDDDLPPGSHSPLGHQDDVDRGYHTDPCLAKSRLICEFDHDDHSRPNGSPGSRIETIESSESSEESNECSLEEILRRGTGLEQSQGVQAALSLYDQAVQDGLLEGALDIAHLEYKMGWLLWKCGSYEKSLSVLKRALHVFESEGGLRVREIAEIHFALGRTLASLGNRKKARKYYMKALRTLEYDQFVDNSVNPENQELSAKILAQVASLLVSHENYDMASGVLNEAITIQRQVLGPHHTDIAGTLLVYGALNEALYRYEYAAKCYLDALEIYRNTTSTTIFSNVDISVTLSNVGWLFYLTNDYANALHSYEEALELAIPVLGEQHRNVSSLHVQMGMVYAQRGDLKMALRTYREALNGQRAILGDEHEDVALTLALVGFVYMEMGKLRKAAEFTEHALSMRKAIMGPNSVVVGMTLVQLGQVYTDMEESVAAANCFSSALATYHVNGLPVTDPRVTEARESLSQMGGWAPST